MSKINLKTASQMLSSKEMQSIVGGDSTTLIKGGDNESCVSPTFKCYCGTTYKGCVGSICDCVKLCNGTC